MTKNPAKKMRFKFGILCLSVLLGCKPTMKSQRSDATSSKSMMPVEDFKADPEIQDRLAQVSAIFVVGDLNQGYGLTDQDSTSIALGVLGFSVAAAFGVGGAVGYKRLQASPLSSAKVSPANKTKAVAGEASSTTPVQNKTGTTASTSARQQSAIPPAPPPPPLPKTNQTRQANNITRVRDASTSAPQPAALKKLPEDTEVITVKDFAEMKANLDAVEGETFAIAVPKGALPGGTSGPIDIQTANGAYRLTEFTEENGNIYSIGTRTSSKPPVKTQSDDLAPYTPPPPNPKFLEEFKKPDAKQARYLSDLNSIEKDVVAEFLQLDSKYRKKLKFLEGKSSEQILKDMKNPNSNWDEDAISRYMRELASEGNQKERRVLQKLYYLHDSYGHLRYVDEIKAFENLDLDHIRVRLNLTRSNIEFIKNPTASLMEYGN